MQHTVTQYSHPIIIEMEKSLNKLAYLELCTNLFLHGWVV